MHSVQLSVEATPTAPALSLRPWSEHDLPALIEIFRDPLLRRWSRRHVTDHADGLRWLEFQQHGWDTGRRPSFAVHQHSATAPDRLVGQVVLERDDPHGTEAEVGYWTAAHARGQGIAPRALETLTAWAFDKFAADGLTQLHLLHDVDNAASCRVAHKTGYPLGEILPAQPPEFPRDGHRHTRDLGTALAQR